MRPTHCVSGSVTVTSAFNARAVLAKIREEIDEVEVELDAGRPDLAEAELGDLMFVVVNLARHLKADPEAALRGRKNCSHSIVERLRHHSGGSPGMRGRADSSPSRTAGGKPGRSLALKRPSGCRAA